MVIVRSRSFQATLRQKSGCCLKYDEKKDIVPTLTITFTPATMTGVVLTACGQNADSSTDIWNFNLGALLIVLCSMHIIREKTG